MSELASEKMFSVHNCKGLEITCLLGGITFVLSINKLKLTYNVLSKTIE